MTNNKTFSYSETHTLQLNVYLFFYLYIVFIIMIANLLPVSTITYFIFLILGIAGISILLVKFTYNLSIDENSIRLSIKIPVKIKLVDVKLKDIKDIEEIKTSAAPYHKQNANKRYTFYTFKKENGMKLTMVNGKVYIISGIDTYKIIGLIKPGKEK